MSDATPLLVERVTTGPINAGRCQHCYNDVHIDSAGYLVGPTGDARYIIYDSRGAFLSHAGMSHAPLPVIR